MGPQDGTAAPVFATHESYYREMGKIHDVLLVENVPEYDTDIPQQQLDKYHDDAEKEMWGSLSEVVDPRIFGIPAARARLFYLAFRKDRVKLRTDVCLDCIRKKHGPLNMFHTMPANSCQFKRGGHA